MRFNTADTTLLLFIIPLILDRLSEESTIKVEQFDLITLKLNENEYIKGKLLNFLYNELNRFNLTFDTPQKLDFESLLKRIKFKATPR